MDAKLTDIPNDDKQNHPFYRLQLLVEMFWTLLKKINKSTQNLKPTNKTLGTSVINRL